MNNILTKISLFSAILIMLSSTALAYSGDLSLKNQNINFSSDNFLEGKTVRIYASVTNNSNRDLLGVVRFSDNGNQIGGDQAISIFAQKSDGVFIDWTPSYGNHRIAVKIYPWDTEIDNPDNNWIVTEVFAAQDTDHDGIANTDDDDDDGDGVIDEEDAFPLNSNEQYDTDGDSIGDNTDDDDDNDEVPDEFDDMPLDPNETMDTDNDGIGNIADSDDDNDHISDTDEDNTGTDPLKYDTDEDGTNDKEDAFPLDNSEWLDTDHDNIGNNIDIDDDNDGIPDEKDEYPLNKGPVIKLQDDSFSANLYEEQTFDASPSYDEDGKVISYIWKIDNKELKEGNSIKHIFDDLGKHVIELTIIDNSGESRTNEFQVNVLDLKFYKQTIASIIAILLAILIFFKYIAGAKKSEE